MACTGHLIISISVIFSSCQIILGSPHTRPKFGPEGGMEFLHGVLMHGDEQPGDAHRQEDEYQRLQALDRQRAEAKERKDGPCEGMDCLHGVLMHADDKQGVEHMEQEPGPQPEAGQGPAGGQTAGPCQGMDCLHGVLMHGDEETGEDHKRQDAKLVQVEIKKSGATDPEHLLHQTGEAHKHQEDPTPENPKFTGVKSGTSDPEHLLHQGDENIHAESNKTANSTEKQGAKPMSLASDPEHLLHGDSKEVHGDNVQSKTGTPAPIRSGAMDPEHFLHGNDGADVHDQQRQKLKEEAATGSKDPVSPLDPDELLHSPDGKRTTIGTMTKEEAKDYKEWKDEKATAKDDGGYLGFSFPFISDTIFDEIEILKRRYLSKFWGTDENSANTENDVTNTPIPSSASPKYDVNGDMRHELDAIGNTEPLKDHAHDAKERSKKDL